MLAGVASSSTLTVEFRPRLWEAFWASLILLVGIGQLVLGAAFAFTTPGKQLDCDRTKCTLVAHTLFGGSQEFTLDVPELRDSTIAQAPHHMVAWTVQSHGQRFELGNPTDDKTLAQTYDHLARDFQSFLSDPSKPSYSVAFASVAKQPLWLFAVLGVLFIAWGIKWRRGWKVRLVFDRAAGTLTIHQRPWKLTRTIPLAQIKSVEVSDQIAHTLYGNLRWERVELRGGDGKPAWRYRTMFTRKTYQHVQEQVQLMRGFLAGR
jgi:hypothetical protein